MKKIREIGLKLADPKIMYYTLIWLMVLLVAGTIAQKYIGLYRAQNMFFSSILLWVGPIPLPGGMPTIGVIFIGLLAKLIFASPWNWKQSGTIITHFGALLLLFGGLLTTINSQEGNMVIYEGASSDYFSDFHHRELVVFDAVYGDELLNVPWKKLKEGAIFEAGDLGFTIEIVKRCKNCEFVARTENDPLVDELRGRAKNFDIQPVKLENEDEKNKSGIMFRLKGVNEREDGIHFSVDFIEVYPNVEIGESTYSVGLRKKKTFLPFKIRLIDFRKEFHPGTNIPRHFSSEVVLSEGDSEWRSLIKMNEPLRYRGYTFFQASYVLQGDREATVLAVVKNLGRSFPYVSSIVMCIGLLINIFLRIPKLIQRR